MEALQSMWMVPAGGAVIAAVVFLRSLANYRQHQIERHNAEVEAARMRQEFEQRSQRFSSRGRGTD